MSSPEGPLLSLKDSLDLFEEALLRSEEHLRELAFMRLRELFCLKCGSRVRLQACSCENDE